MVGPDAEHVAVNEYELVLTPWLLLLQHVPQHLHLSIALMLLQILNSPTEPGCSLLLVSAAAASWHLCPRRHIMHGGSSAGRHSVNMTYE